MKIKRFHARDMRDAIRRVREEQGPDAVVLSTERTADGVVLIAAVDYDEALMQQALGVVRQEMPKPSPAKKQSPPATAKNTAAARPAPQKPTAPRRPAKAAGTGADVAALDSEIRSIKRMLEDQVARLSWTQFDREHPLRANLLRELTALGLSSSIASRILQQVPPQLDAARAARLPLGLLAKQLPAAEHDLAEAGGKIAIVGPTGVGKTTTIAKIAARHVMRFGREGIALVTTDMFRIGGQEQLYHFGRLLGVPVYGANNAGELQETLELLRERRLVLIDTAGMSHRDMRLNAQLAMLRAGHPALRIQLALSANQQAAVLDDVASKFIGCHPDGLILTKLDEAAELGGAISAAIKHRLPVNYVTDGQKVPEDLKLMRAHQLVARAVDLVRHRQRPDDVQLAGSFGGIAHALA